MCVTSYTGIAQLLIFLCHDVLVDFKSLGLTKSHIMYKLTYLENNMAEGKASNIEQFQQQKDEFQNMQKTAFIIGYGGSIGSALLESLIDQNIFKKIVLIGRSKKTFPDEDRYITCVTIIIVYLRNWNNIHVGSISLI